MSRHAKNNTASSCFTAHEKQQLKYGTVKQRLGKESFRDFNCCSLCLKIVTDPHACHKGHLYCKECIFQNLLTQKKAIKRLNQLYEQQEQEQQEKKETEEEKRKEAEIQEFDKVECGVLPTNVAINKRERDGNIVEYHTNEGKKVFLDPSVADSKEAQELLKKQKDKDIAPEKKMAAFWLPSFTPSFDETIKRPKNNTKCPAGNHTLRLKQLTEVKFTINSENKFNCPVCNKVFTNASKATLFSKCGHVTCNKCWKEMIKEAQRCIVCNTRCPSSTHIQLDSGGTGFAGHHGDKLEAKIQTPAAWV